MWKILKAEVAENWYVLIIPYIIVVLPIAINISKGWPTAEFDLRGIQVMMAVAIALILLVKMPRLFKEQKDRIHAMLPLSRRALAASRFLFPCVIWASFLCIFWLGTSMVRPYLQDLIIWQVLSLTGFVLLGASLPLIYRDLVFCIPRKYQKFLLPVFYFLLPMAVYIVFYLFFSTRIPYFDFLKQVEPYQLKYAAISSTQAAAFWFIFFGLVFICTSLLLFRLRKEYLR